MRFTYEGKTYQLTAGDGVFIDCVGNIVTVRDIIVQRMMIPKRISGFFSGAFYAPCLPAVYEKYRGEGWQTGVSSG